MGVKEEFDAYVAKIQIMLSEKSREKIDGLAESEIKARQGLQ